MRVKQTWIDMMASWTENLANKTGMDSYLCLFDCGQRGRPWERFMDTYENRQHHQRIRTQTQNFICPCNFLLKIAFSPRKLIFLVIICIIMKHHKPLGNPHRKKTEWVSWFMWTFHYCVQASVCKSKEIGRKRRKVTYKVHMEPWT